MLAGNKYSQFSMGNRGSQPDSEDDASQRPLVVPESDESQKRREYFAACADDRARQAQVQTSTLAAAKPASCSCQLQIIITHTTITPHRFTGYSSTTLCCPHARVCEQLMIAAAAAACHRSVRNVRPRRPTACSYQ